MLLCFDAGKFLTVRCWTQSLGRSSSFSTARSVPLCKAKHNILVSSYCCWIKCHWWESTTPTDPVCMFVADALRFPLEVKTRASIESQGSSFCIGIMMEPFEETLIMMHESVDNFLSSWRLAWGAQLHWHLGFIVVPVLEWASAWRGLLFWSNKSPVQTRISDFRVRHGSTFSLIGLYVHILQLITIHYWHWSYLMAINGYPSVWGHQFDEIVDCNKLQ